MDVQTDRGDRAGRREGLRAKARRVAGEAYERLRGGEITPFRAAASVAVGLAIGVTPLWGFHIWLVLAVCLPLRLDAAIAYLASNISLPFIAPFLSFAEIEIGARVTTGAWLDLTRDAVRAGGITPFLKQLVVGTVVFSPAIALVGGGVTYAATRALMGRREETELGRVFSRVAARYARGRRGAHVYVHAKLTHDPVVQMVAEEAERARFDEVVDLGCGRGQLALVLLEAGAARHVHGIDWDERKVADARDAAAAGAPLDATFEQGDARTAELPACDALLLVDVLHYFTDDEQDAILKRAAAAARRAVIVRDLDPDRGFRSKVTRFQEAITTAVRFNRGARLRIRPIAAMERVLVDAGFDVEVTPCWRGTPFANVLVVATRRST